MYCAAQVGRSSGMGVTPFGTRMSIFQSNWRRNPVLTSAAGLRVRQWETLQEAAVPAFCTAAFATGLVFFAAVLRTAAHLLRVASPILLRASTQPAFLRG